VIVKYVHNKFWQHHTVVLVNQQLFKSRQTQHLNSVRSFYLLSYNMFRSSHSAIIKKKNTLLHYVLVFFYLIMVEWNDKNML